MKALIQRVRSANVVVNQQLIGSIEQGLLVLLAVESHDKPEAIEKMAHKLLNYRLFSDDPTSAASSSCPRTAAQADRS